LFSLIPRVQTIPAAQNVVSLSDASAFRNRFNTAGCKL
jgi:hypothetical protein